MSMIPHVTAMYSRSGKAVPNQIIIHTHDGAAFQSYATVIAFRPHDTTCKVQLDAAKWNYSKTTSQYRNEFLHETTKETLAKIASGEYELVNLNR